MKKLLSIALAVLAATTAQASKIQQQGIVKHADCSARGVSDANCIPTSDQVFDTTNNQLLTTSIANGQLGGGGGGGTNLLKSSDNPGFEAGTTAWTASGGTFTGITSGQLYGLESGQWTASAASQTLYSNLKPLSAQPALENNNCLAAISYSYPSGAGGDYSLVVSDGTNILANLSLNVTLSPQDASVSFVCPASGSLEVGLQSNVASPSAIIIDGASFNGGQVLLGSNILINALSQSSYYGGIVYPSVGQNWGPITSAGYSNFSANSSQGTPTAEVNASAPSTKIPGVTFASLPPGDYQVIVQGDLFANAPDTCVWTISDGTNTSGAASINNVPNGNQSVIVSRFSYSSAQSNITFQVQAANVGSSAGCFIHLNNTVDQFTIRAYRFPTSTQQAYTTSQTPASWSGYQSASSGCTTSSSTFADPSACTLSLTQTTNRNFGSVSNAASSLPGILFTPTRSGMKRVTAIVHLNNSGTANVAARLVDGANNPVDAGRSVDVVSGTSNANITLSGLYYATSTSALTFKIQIATASGTLTISNGPSVGNAIQWVVEDADATTGVPVIVGSINSPSNGGKTLSSASMTAVCTSSPCAYNQDGNWISSINWAAMGQYPITFTSAFKNPPRCWCNETENRNINCEFQSITTTSMTLYTQVQFTGTVNNGQADIFCLGDQ